MKNLTVLIFLLTLNILSVAQEDVNPRRPFNHISFEDYHPLWYTTLLDSSLIDKTIHRNQINGFTINQDVPEVVSNRNLYYSLFISRESDFEGSYFGTIDINTGEKKWNNYFCLATQDKQEFTQTMIVENDRIEFLGLKTQSLYGSGIGPISLFDTTCWMTKRVYDKNSGILLENSMSDPFAANTQRMTKGSRRTTKYSQIFKIDNNTYKYIHHNKTRPDNTIDFCNLNEKGERKNTISSIKLNKRLDKFNYFQIKTDRYLLIEDDFLADNNRYTLHLFGDDFDTLQSVRTTDLIPKDAHIHEVNKEDGYITLSTITYDDSDSFLLYPDKWLWVLDFEGQTLKKVRLEDNFGVAMWRYVFNYNMPLNELVVAFAIGQGLFDPPKFKLQFYTASGSSNVLQLRKEISVEDSLKVILLNKMTRTPKGNLILLWDEYDLYEQNGRYVDGDIFSVATSYICFDSKTLGLESVVFDTPKNQKLNVFPNPSFDIVSIQNLNQPAKVTIYNLSGEIVKSLTDIENQISIIDLPAGMYVIVIRNKEISERHKIVKVE